MKRIQENEFGFKKDIGSRDRSIDVDEYNLSINVSLLSIVNCTTLLPRDRVDVRSLL